jgi:transposase
LTHELYFNVGMAEPYDVVFRQRAVAAYQAGEGGYHRLAEMFGIAYRTLQRWVAQARATGTVTPQPKGGGWVCPIDVAMLKTIVRAAPDGTVTELCWEYNRRVAAAKRTNETSFRRAMRRAGFVLKKNARGRARSTGRMWQPSAKRS